MKIKPRFELSFVNISQLEKKLKYCETNDINKINIPCKGVIKKNLYIETVEYIIKQSSWCFCSGENSISYMSTKIRS